MKYILVWCVTLSVSFLGIDDFTRIVRQCHIAIVESTLFNVFLFDVQNRGNAYVIKIAATLVIVAEN